MTRSPAAASRRRFAPDVRREQILDVAEQLFVERGYASVSMSDIAAELGVTRPVANYHFGSKETVYLECVRRARASYDMALLTRIDLNAAPRDQLAAGADAFFEILENSPERWILLFGTSSVLAGDASKELADLRFATIDAIAALLSSSMPKATDMQIQAAAHAASGVGERLGHWWLREPSLTRQDLVEHFTEVLWGGLGQYV